MNPPLAKKHTGMRVNAGHALEIGTSDRCKNRKGYAFMASELTRHLQEAADRYYAGDVTGCDELFQLYCFDQKRPASAPPQPHETKLP